MNYANIKYNDIANGDGVRTSLFVSGCNHHCKDCFNEEAWDFDYGKQFTFSIIENIIKSLKPYYISGLTILGGEPLDPKNISVVKELVKHVKAEYPNKVLWVYSGYTWEQLLERSESEPILKYILYTIDVLVDGPFISDLKDISLIFRGSSNQRIINVQQSLDNDEIILYKK